MQMSKLRLHNMPKVTQLTLLSQDSPLLSSLVWVTQDSPSPWRATPHLLGPRPEPSPSGVASLFPQKGRLSASVTFRGDLGFPEAAEGGS